MKTSVKQPIRSAPTKAPPTINVTEQHQLLNELLYGASLRQPEKVRTRNHCMALLMLDAGLRVGEVTRLLATDLLLKGEPVLAIHLTADHTKNGTERTVPLSTRIISSIKAMRDSAWQEFKGHPSTYAFFSHHAWRPLSTRQARRIIARAAIRSIGRPIHPHVLRHTFASKLMRVTNARVVQELLGHKSITSTEVYTHPNEDDKTSAIKSAEIKKPLIILFLFLTSIANAFDYPCYWCEWRNHGEQLPPVAIMVYHDMVMRDTPEHKGCPLPPNDKLFLVRGINIYDGYWPRRCDYNRNAFYNPLGTLDDWVPYDGWHCGFSMVSQLYTYTELYYWDGLSPGMPSATYFSISRINDCFYTGDVNTPFREEDCNDCPVLYRDSTKATCRIIFPPAEDWADFNDDGIVNFRDFAMFATIFYEDIPDFWFREFAAVWLEES